MRFSNIAVALFFVLICTVHVNAQCNINATAVFSACPVGTGCSWTDPIWACGSFPNGAAVTANIGEPGNYQINVNSVNLPSLILMNLNLGTNDNKNDTYQILSISGVNIQLSSAVNIASRGVLLADFQSSSFNGQLTNGGQVNFISGTFSSTAQITNSANAQFNVTSTATHSLGQPFQNSGNFRVMGAPLTLTNAIQFNNDGILELSDAATIATTTLGAEKITSAGTIRFRTVSTPNVASSIDVQLESPGLVDVTQLGYGRITSDNSFIDNLNVAAGSTFYFSAPNLALKNVVSNGSLYWASGDLTIKTSGVFLNDATGLWTISTANSINSADGTGFIRNRGIISTSASDLITFGAPVYLLAGNLNQGGTGGLYFRNLNVAGGRLGGTGPITVNTFNWDSGEISGYDTINITGAATISGAAKVLSGSRKLLFSGQAQSQISSSITASSSGTTITIAPTGIVNFGSATFSLTNPLVNNGRVTGVATINGAFTNTGILGASEFSATSNAIKLQINGILTLTDTSVVNVDLFSDTNDYGYIRCSQVANLNGKLKIRARDGLYGTTGAQLNIVSANTIIGNFTSVELDSSQWPNPNQCTITAAFDPVDGVTVTFSGCAGSAPGPTPKPASTRLRTFAIVFVVIVVIIIAVGVIAKCQKKCRKRPWDRLRDDRY